MEYDKLISFTASHCTKTICDSYLENKLMNVSNFKQNIHLYVEYTTSLSTYTVSLRNEVKKNENHFLSKKVGGMKSL